ncbi:MAG: hypothetical protein J6Q52_05815 [Clostridia bacterium]|nr:hypothetical protein [Clostridia bacterium]
MISTTYQPYVALILFLTGVVVYALSTIITLLTRRLTIKWLRVVVDVMIVLASYLIVGVVAYLYDYGRLRLYTPLCIVGGMLSSHLVKKLAIYVSKSSKSR